MLSTLYAALASDKRSERGGLSAKTISYIHTIIHKALADAVDADRVARNVADRAKPPRPDRRATPGMRRGKVLGLRWSDVDLESARLSVRQALVTVGYDVITSTPKSQARE
jgi:integrase